MSGRNISYDEWKHSNDAIFGEIKEINRKLEEVKLEIAENRGLGRGRQDTLENLLREHGKQTEEIKNVRAEIGNIQLATVTSASEHLKEHWKMVTSILVATGVIGGGAFKVLEALF